MNKLWSRINLTLAVANFLIGLGFVYMLYQSISEYVDYQAVLEAQLGAEFQDRPVLRMYHIYLVPLLSAVLLITSGILMVFRTKAGWVLSNSFWIIMAFSLCSILLIGNIDITTTEVESEYSMNVVAGIGFSLAILLLTIHWLRQIRRINRIANREQLMSLGLAVILFATIKILN